MYVRCRRIVITFALALMVMAATSTRAAAAPVGLELLLLVDVSGSVDSSEYNLQRTGYVNAFLNGGIQSQIAAIANGIAVGYVEWSSASQQVLLVNWTHVTDAASATDFANAIAGTSRAFSGSTAPGSAINFGTPLFTNNGFEGDRLVMDVSGDGSQNDGAATAAAAANAFANGITVNGLAILTDDPGLGTWYQNNIVTPGGGFLEIANDFGDFESAVAAKIGREIAPTPVPEPTTLLLTGAGLFASAWRARSRRRA
jgi:hypothetical protein